MPCLYLVKGGWDAIAADAVASWTHAAVVCTLSSLPDPNPKPHSSSPLPPPSPPFSLPAGEYVEALGPFLSHQGVEACCVLLQTWRSNGVLLNEALQVGQRWSAQ
jgi:hypothetical protein